MPTTDEEHALRLWFEALDPAVDVKLTDHDVEVRSSRRGRERSAVRCKRSSNLYDDLNRALAQLVHQLS